MKQAKWFSIYGQCEEAAARTMIKAGKASTLPLLPGMAVDVETGRRAVMVLVVPAKHVKEFEEMCRDLRA